MIAVLFENDFLISLNLHIEVTKYLHGNLQQYLK